MNDNTPQGRRLSEAQSSDMEAFIDQLQIVLPVLGVNVIRSRRTTVSAPVEATTSPVFTLSNVRRGVDARAQLVDGEFTILAGSTIVPEWNGVGKAASTVRSYASYRAQHERLVADGSVVVDGSAARVTRDIRFGSPSTAGAVALGHSCNGREAWTWSGGNYGQWEIRGLQ